MLGLWFLRKLAPDAMEEQSDRCGDIVSRLNEVLWLWPGCGKLLQASLLPVQRETSRRVRASDPRRLAPLWQGWKGPDGARHLLGRTRKRGLGRNVRRLGHLKLLEPSATVTLRPACLAARDPLPATHNCIPGVPAVCIPLGRHRHVWEPGLRFGPTMEDDEDGGGSDGGEGGGDTPLRRSSGDFDTASRQSSATDIHTGFSTGRSFDPKRDVLLRLEFISARQVRASKVASASTCVSRIALRQEAPAGWSVTWSADKPTTTHGMQGRRACCRA